MTDAERAHLYGISDSERKATASNAQVPSPRPRLPTRRNPMTDAERARLLALVPTNWVDSLLTGPTAVLGTPPYDCEDVERLLRAVRKRLEDELTALTPPVDSM